MAENSLVLHRIDSLDALSATVESCLSKFPMTQPRLMPLQSTLNHISTMGCRCVIVQQRIQDPDYTAEYHAFHGRMFSNVDRFCTRIHFFSCAHADGTNVLDVIDSSSNDDYLGFITLRPIVSSPVGASILQPPNGHFLLSKDDFDVHLAGKTFSVNGTPFMQQDNAVGACAQASIWMALRTLRRKAGLGAHDPAQITIAATRFLVRGRTLPNREGLQIDQMMEAVRSAGYSPNLLMFRDPNSAPSKAVAQEIRYKLYPYIESGIPVIVAIASEHVRGHAVVLIGHGWDANPAEKIAASQGIISASSWAKPFYIHNDNTGPYLPLPDEGAEGEYSLDKICYAIPLLPTNVYLNAEEAEKSAIEIIKQAIHMPSNLVVRTYLQERYKFREYVLNSIMCDGLKKYYRLKELPRRVWVTEINMLHEYGSITGENNVLRIGEIVLDPTGEPEQAPFLSAHFPNVLFDRDPDTKLIQVTPVPGDTPYVPLMR